MRFLVSAAIGAAGIIVAPVTPIEAIAQPSYYAPDDIIIMSVLDLNLETSIASASEHLRAQGWSGGFTSENANRFAGPVEMQSPIWHLAGDEITLARFQHANGDAKFWQIVARIENRDAIDVFTRRDAELAQRPAPTSTTELGNADNPSIRLRWSSGPLLRMRFDEQEAAIRNVYEQCELHRSHSTFAEGCPTDINTRFGIRVAHAQMMTPAILEIRIAPDHTEYNLTAEYLYQIEDMRRITLAEVSP